MEEADSNEQRGKPKGDHDELVIEEVPRECAGSSLLYSPLSTYNVNEVVHGGVWCGNGQQHVSLLWRAY